MENKNKVDKIHDLLPKHYKTRVNPNWKSLVEAIGANDQETAELIEQVRQQFFVRTASRPYIDRLGANFKVSRPKFIGMDDTDFRRYIPILAYKPKQVKLIIDQLLDIFFLKESTTAFINATAVEPYVMRDGWELEYTVDQYTQEKILFKADFFTDPMNATADEIANIINRQAVNSFAIVYEDNLRKTRSVRMFTNTVGSKGSIQLTGGRANISLRFKGIRETAGNGPDTIWNITLVGDTVTMTYVSGTAPGLEQIQIGDIAMIDIPGNEGSFTINNINLSTNSFTFTNSSATPMVFDHSSDPVAAVGFFTPEKFIVYNQDLRAIAWEVKPGEIIIEIPASPPIVKRQLKGSSHINGTVGEIVSRISGTELELSDATDWPDNGGFFVLQPKNEIKSHIETLTIDTIESKTFNSQFDIAQKYQYISKTGNVLSGITPDLPMTAAVFETPIVSASRDSNNIVTAITSAPHGLEVGEPICVMDTIPAVDLDPDIHLSDLIDGAFYVTEIVNPTSFKYRSFGDKGQATGGKVKVERILMSNQQSIAYLTTGQLNTGIIGPYVWDLAAPFVMSSLSGTLTEPIKAGNAQRNVIIDPVNTISNEEGYLVFDFGLETQEGPVRYLYKASDSTLVIDPAYIFKFNHEVGGAVSMIRRRGAHVMSSLGTEYPPYITDPAAARPILQELIKQVKSVGIFLNFIVRYPQQYYATLDVYDVGVDPG